MNRLEENPVQCPYCGEMQTTLIDTSAGNQHYIEDCQICCSPIQFVIELDHTGDIKQIITRRDNE